MVVILESLSADRSDIFALVLTADGIGHRVIKSWSGWAIAVRPEDAARAIAGIDTYLRENPEIIPSQDTAASLRQASW